MPFRPAYVPGDQAPHYKFSIYGVREPVGVLGIENAQQGYPVPVRIVVDRVPPFIEIQKFVVLRTGRGQEVLVNGRTEPGATVTVGGMAVVVDGNGYFSAVLKGLAPGRTQMEIVARDRAGNVKSFQQAVQS